MVKAAKVNMRGIFVGGVAWDENRDYAVFEFDPGFLKRGLDLSPIKMPLSDAINGRRIFSFTGLNK